MDEIASDVKAPSGTATLTPWHKIQEQLHHLDRALSTIDGWSDESNHTRGFIVGQIEALKWAAKLIEV